MSAALQQIKAAFEIEKMTPEEIAQDLGMEVASIKAALMQTSTEYRKLCRGEDDDDEGLNFSNNQLREINRVIYELAVGAEDEHLRGRMATYIRDDKKGRREAAKVMSGGTFNILQFNQAIQQVRGELKKKLVEV